MVRQVPRLGKLVRPEGSTNLSLAISSALLMVSWSKNGVPGDPLSFTT